MQHIILDRSRLSDLDCIKGPSMIIQFPNILSLLGVIEQSDLISLTVHKRARKAIRSWKRDTLRRTLERCVTVLRKLTTLTLLFLLLFNESQVTGHDKFCSIFGSIATERVINFAA